MVCEIIQYILVWALLDEDITMVPLDDSQPFSNKSGSILLYPFNVSAIVKKLHESLQRNETISNDSKKI